ncbi:Hypothetical_protein [Hexamita inflata]|uniref:Hypothetical_protein n=1 Tax=Hexamita inflata TaxID=28002 RepID=A0AA86PB46_9EUKA|nr:Hypothetical protein HINF_LOCUS23196 [Hexamita inflata]
MPFCTVNSQNRCFWPLFSFRQLQSGKACQPSYQKALEQANLFRFQFLLGSLKVTLETKSVKGVKKLISPRNLLISSRTRIYNKKYQNARKMNFKTCFYCSFVLLIAFTEQQGRYSLQRKRRETDVRRIQSEKKFRSNINYNIFWYHIQIKRNNKIMERYYIPQKRQQWGKINNDYYEAIRTEKNRI